MHSDLLVNLLAAREAMVEICGITATGVRSMSVDAARHTLENDNEIVWIDLGHEDREGMGLLIDLLHARPEDVDDCSSRMPVPKLHAYPDHYFSAINGLARGIDGRLYFQPLKIFFNAKLLITVMGPTSKALTPDAVYRDLTLIRERLDSGGLRPTSAFELVTAIRLQMLRTQESLVAEAAARAAELEKSVMGIDPVKAETVLNDLFSLRHDLQTIRTNAAQTHELYVHLIGTLDSQEGLMPLDVRRLNDLRLGFSHLRNPWISSASTCRRCSICGRPGQGCSSRAAEVFPQVGVGTNPRRCAGDVQHRGSVGNQRRGSSR